jgi:uncharacterized damage-inducible protein DinB
MAESDPVSILLSHDRWATDQILEVCGKLTDEQFHQRFEMGMGSLHANLNHMLAAMRAWTDTLRAADPRPRLDADGQRRTPAELKAIAATSCDDLLAEARRLPVSDKVTRKLRDGRTIELTRGTVLTHVATHGMHHRAQCLNMLRQLGVSPLPPSSVVEWAMLGG